MWNTGTSAADGKHNYLKNWTWWAGMGTSKVFNRCFLYPKYLMFYYSGCW